MSKSSNKAPDRTGRGGFKHRDTTIKHRPPP